MRVQNIPSYAYEDEYVVCRQSDTGEWWFYGSYSDLKFAIKVSVEVNGEVFKTAELI